MSSPESSDGERDYEYDEDDDEELNEAETLTGNETAPELKAIGNRLYLAGNIDGAIEMYSKVIAMTPTDAVGWGNRSAAYMANKKFSLALSDALEAIKLQPGFVKAHLRASSCYIQLGDFKNARSVLEPAMSNPTARKDLATLDKIESDFAQARTLITQNSFAEGQEIVMALLSKCSEALALRLLLVECLIGKKQFDQARLMCESLYNAGNQRNLDLVFLRGVVFYYTGSVALAIKHFQQILRSDPDNRKAAKLYKMVKKLERAKNNGNAAFARGDNQEAIRLYTEALALDEKNDAYNCTLYGNRAAARVKLQEWEEAKLDCDRALLTKPDYVKVLLRRAVCLDEMECYAEAIRDLEAAQKLDPGNKDIARKVRQAELELKKSKRKNYYKMLGVNKRATQAEIKKAFRKMALQYHPDKVRNKDQKTRDFAEAKFKDFSEAYEVLSNEQTRRDYDSGKDLQQQGGMHPSQADIFSMFGGMGGMGGGRGHAHGHPGFSFNF